MKRREYRRSAKIYVAEMLEVRRLLAAVAWDGGAGNYLWTSPANWSTDSLPGPADDVTISLPASNPTIVINGGMQSINSLVCDELLSISSGGTLQMETTATFSANVTLAGTVTGGVLNIASGSKLTIPESSISSKLDGTEVHGDLTFQPYHNSISSLILANHPTFDRPITLDGRFATLLFEGSQTFDGEIIATNQNLIVPSGNNVTVTLGPSGVIRGRGNSSIHSGGASGFTFINQGLVTADQSGSTFTLGGTGYSFTNSGILEAKDGGTLGLYDFTAQASGQIRTVNVSTVYLYGTVTGGVLNIASGSKLTIPESSISSKLDGTEVHGDLTFQPYHNSISSLILANHPTFDRPITLDGRFATLLFEGSQTFDGEIIATNQNSIVPSGNNVTVTLGPSGVIRGRGNSSIHSGGASGFTFINQGLVTADQSGSTFTLGGTGYSFTNSGILEAKDGGTLGLYDFTAQASGQIRTVNVSTVYLYGTVTGGVLNIASGSKLTIPESSISSKLDGTEVHGDLTFQPYHNSISSLILANHPTFDRPITLDGRFATLLFEGSQTFDGEIIATNQNSIVPSGNNVTVTLGPSGVIRGRGNSSIHSGGASGFTFINQGLVTADQSGSTFTLGGTGYNFTNSGILEAKDGGTLQISGTIVATPGIVRIFSNSTMRLNGNYITTFVSQFYLDGPNSNIFRDSSGTVDALQFLRVIQSTGGLTMTGGRSLSIAPSSGELLNDGLVSLAPGSTLSVNGAFSQTATGTLQVDISGASPTTGFGNLAASGLANLGGTLDADLLNGYDPDSSASFAVVSGSSATGTFSTFDGDTTPSGRPLKQRNTSTTALVTVGPHTPLVPDLLASSDSGLSNADNITNDSTPTFFGTSANGGILSILTDGQVVGSALISAGNWQIDASPLADAVHVITARLTDADGDESALSPSLAVTIDTVAPQVASKVFEFEQQEAMHMMFSEDVQATASLSTLVLRNRSTNQSIPIGELEFQYNSSTNEATIRRAGFPALRLGDGEYQLTASASGISDIAGNHLASDVTLDFHVLAGDATRDEQVDSIDFNILMAHYGTAGALYSEGDFNYDTKVNTLDFNLLSANFGINAPVFREDFESYQSGTYVPSRNGWEPLRNTDVGALVVVDSGSGLSTKVAAGFVNPQDPVGNRQQAAIHSIPGGLRDDRIYTLSFDAYARTNQQLDHLVTHNAGVAFSHNEFFQQYSIGWSAEHFQSGGLSIPKWVFATSTGRTELIGNFNKQVRLQIVLDPIRERTHGRADFNGDDFFEAVTEEYVMSLANFRSIYGMEVFQDWRSPSTHGGAEFDNLLLEQRPAGQTTTAVGDENAIGLGNATPIAEASRTRLPAGELVPISLSVDRNASIVAGEVPIFSSTLVAAKSDTVWMTIDTSSDVEKWQGTSRV